MSVMANITSGLSPRLSSLTQQQKMKCVNIIVLTLCALMLFMPQFAFATDIFAAGKTKIQASAGTDSTLWFAMTVVGLAVAAVTGFMTKNWFAAIGGFFAGMIFLNVAASIIGLT